MPIPLEQRGQPIVRPCSLTRATVTYQRFCVATGSGTSSLGASSMLTFGLARSHHCKSDACCYNLSQSKSSAWDRPQACRRTLFSIWLTFRILRFPKPDVLQPLNFKLATEQSRSKNPSPRDFAKTRMSTSVTVAPKHIHKGLSSTRT